MAKKIRILGAGPAGLSCAINLAKAGYQVEILEKEGDCGTRFNGDFQGLENWSGEIDVLDDLKNMNIEINFPARPFTKVIAYDHELDCTELSDVAPIFYLVRRGSMKRTLDQGLKLQGKRLGVNIKFQTISNNIDIVATGPSCADAIAKGITFRTKMSDQACIFCDDEIAPKGYAYFLVSQGYGCLVTAMFRHFHKEQEYFDKMKKKVTRVLDLQITNVREFGGFGNFFLERKYFYDNKIHIGEAAGLQDFFAGFGMRYAMTSGYLAAQSIVEQKDFEQVMRHRFEKYLENSVANRFLYERLGNFGYKILISRLAKVAPVSFLKEFYKPNLLKSIILPLAKLSMKSKEDRHKNCECVWCRSKRQEVE